MSNVMDRPACRWATYNGDQRHAVGQAMGPTTLGDWVTVVEATYDEATDTTRLGFAFGLPASEHADALTGGGE